MTTTTLDLRLAPVSHAAPAPAARRAGRRLHVALWVVQTLLALLFLFAGSVKWVTPAEALAAQSGFSAAFMHFIGACEMLGALGLVLPGLFRIRTGLTPLAACGLAVIMTGAVSVTVARGPAAAAAVPLAVGLLAAFVAVGRARRA